jgi:hypothetical protein
MTDPRASDDPAVSDPTWNGNIRNFFDAGDIACMNAQGLDLSSYESVRENAGAIYDEVKSGNMPAGGPPWSAGRVSTFANWMAAGFPLGSGSGDTPVPPEPPADDPMVEHPTWTGDISKFFRPGDIGCMKAQGIDLSTYAGVRSHATDIYLQTKTGNMPYGGPRWTKNRVETFFNWIGDRFPVGGGAPAPSPVPDPSPAPGARLRKNVNSLTAAEIETLKKAFRGIMALDPADPNGPVNLNSYYGQAAIHGLPLAYCMHHVDTYNPWHRVYITRFEDALRSIEGCEDLTLPYWDIKTEVPALMYEAPFASYALPRDVGSGFPKGYVTQRHDPATIWTKLTDMPTVASMIDEAMPGKNSYGGFNMGGYQDPIMGAHDDGHVSCGSTMAQQDVAAFDPIFWFFHCNWERLFWSWQVNAAATTVEGFAQKLVDGGEWLALALDPYADTTEQVVAYGDVTYEELDPGVPVMLANKVGHVDAASRFVIEPSSPVSIRVKDIDRMNISGSFIVRLLADGEPIARRAFFQPGSPRTCDTCQKKELISLDFHLPQEMVQGRELSIAIEVVAPREGEPALLAPAMVGNPTINARLLLNEA